MAQVGDNARVETEGQGPLGQYFQGNCRRRGLKAPAQHGKMDGGIRLTEAAQGFLFAGLAEKGGGGAALDTPSSSAARAPLILRVPYPSEAGSSTT